MPIQDDINRILHAQSGEAVRGAIVNAIQDLNQNGGNAQTLNGHYSDEFTKNAEFQDFIDEEVGQIHLVLDAINKGITLRVIELGVHELKPEGGTLLIEVPETVRDRQLLTVDDFYADIVEVASGSGSNAHWEKTAYYDTVDCTYTYSYGALASKMKLHFYAKRASATAVQDYNVHPMEEEVTRNDLYTAPVGEAWSSVQVNVPVPVLQQEKTVSLSSSTTVVPDPDYDAMESVQVNIESPSLEQGGVVVNQATYDQTFTPTSPNIGFSEFRVQANVQFNTQAEEVRISDAEFEDITVTPDSLHAGLSQVTIVNDMQLEEVTVNQNGDVTPGPGYAALKKVTVQVPQQSIETGKSVTYSSGGTYTVNPSSGFNAMYSVEVNVQTPRLQPSKSVTLSQSGTITPDPNYDAMEEVVVTISGGGGGNCNIVDQETWDSYTFDQKKASNLTVIRNSPNDIKGVWYDLHNLGGSDYIPYSQIIICEATIDNFDATSHSWGVGPNPLTLENLLTANADGIGVDIKGQQSHDGVYCDLEDINTDFTAYLVFRYSQAYSYGRILCSSYQSAYNEETYICQSSNTGLKAGTWGSDPDIGTAHTVDTYIVVAMRNNGGVASFFKNTTKGQDKNPNHFGQYIAIASSHPNGYSYATNLTVAYVGIVGEAESDLTILDNIDVLMNKFNIS